MGIRQSRQHEIACDDSDPWSVSNPRWALFGPSINALDDSYEFIRNHQYRRSWDTTGHGRIRKSIRRQPSTIFEEGQLADDENWSPIFKGSEDFSEDVGCGSATTDPQSIDESIEDSTEGSEDFWEYVVSEPATTESPIIDESVEDVEDSAGSIEWDNWSTEEGKKEMENCSGIHSTEVEAMGTPPAANKALSRSIEEDKDKKNMENCSGIYDTEDEVIEAPPVANKALCDVIPLHLKLLAILYAKDYGTKSSANYFHFNESDIIEWMTDKELRYILGIPIVVQIVKLKSTKTTIGRFLIREGYETNFSDNTHLTFIFYLPMPIIDSPTNDVARPPFSVLFSVQGDGRKLTPYVLFTDPDSVDQRIINYYDQTGLIKIRHWRKWETFGSTLQFWMREVYSSCESDLLPIIILDEDLSDAVTSETVSFFNFLGAQLVTESTQVLSEFHALANNVIKRLIRNGLYESFLDITDVNRESGEELTVVQLICAIVWVWGKVSQKWIHKHFKKCSLRL